MFHAAPPRAKRCTSAPGIRQSSPSFTALMRPEMHQLATVRRDRLRYSATSRTVHNSGPAIIRTTNPTIADIITSLSIRGFLNARELRAHLDMERVQIQLDAVLEELGETARLLRRHSQARETIDPTQLATETADVMIAAVCLFVTAAGHDAPAVLTAKLAADEARGWLHSGLTREQYEHRNQP